MDQLSPQTLNFNIKIDVFQIQTSQSKVMVLYTDHVKNHMLCALLNRLSCDPVDSSLAVSSVHGILQARTLEWVATPSSRRSSRLKDGTHVSCLLHWQGGSLLLAPPGKQVKVKVTQSCLTLCDPMNYTVHEILQARILEWVAFSFSRGSSQPRDRTQFSWIAGGFFTTWATKEAQEYWSG